jgi:hypothetical protein
MSYNPDPNVVSAIRRIGRKRGVPDRWIETALATGLVESGLQNLSGGDADSAGWRQERASLYKDPTNLQHSVNRFYDELKQHDRGQSIGELAADVQRPAAQYRGRYGKASVLSAAQKLMGQSMPTSMSGPQSSMPADIQAPQPNQPNLFQLFAQQGQANPSDDPLQATLQRGWALLGELQARKQAGGGSTGSMISSMSSGEPTPSLPPTGSSGKVILSKGADRPGVHTNKAVLNFVGQIAGAYGHPLTIGTGTNHNQMTVNGNVSDHWSGNAADIPATGNTLVKLGQDALIQAGMNPSQARKQTGGLYNVNGYQVIFNTHEGGDHTNHLHVGLGRRHK